MPVEAEYQRARSPKLRTTVFTESCSAEAYSAEAYSAEAYSAEAYSLLDTGCEGYAFMDATCAEARDLPMLPLRRPFKLYGFADEDDEA